MPKRDIASYIDERPSEGIFRVDRAVYNDPEVLEAEYVNIFEKSWIFLCHESFVPNPGDFYATHIGRQPVFVVRGQDGKLGCYLNACGHRGALLVSRRVGNAKSFDCPYHGFCFDTKGDCISVRNRRTGWPDDFQISHFNLKPVARLDSYRGLVFGSLCNEGPSLKEHLGAATKLIDVWVAPAPHELEIVGGFCVYVSNCNWKVMHENGPDAYHAPVVHRNFADTIAYRQSRVKVEGVNKTDGSRLTGRVESASYDLGNGHTAFWHERNDPEAFPIYAQKAELEKRFTPGQMKWILGRGRHMTVFPNLLMNDLASTHLRTYRPLSVDKMETTIWCIAPKGEPKEMRTARIRKFEDFFLPSGMATPDDIAICENAQAASWALASNWTDMGRGSAFRIDGPDAAARDLGFEPVASSNSWDHEIAMQAVYRQWRGMMTAGSGARR